MESPSCQKTLCRQEYSFQKAPGPATFYDVLLWMSMESAVPILRQPEVSARQTVSRLGYSKLTAGGWKHWKWSRRFVAFVVFLGVFHTVRVFWPFIKRLVGEIDHCHWLFSLSNDCMRREAELTKRRKSTGRTQALFKHPLLSLQHGHVEWRNHHCKTWLKIESTTVA